MKKLLTSLSISISIVALPLIAGLLTSSADAEVIGGPGVSVETYYVNLHEEGEVINSFDFGRNGTLYYTTGIKGPAGCETGFSVYKYDGESFEQIYYDENAFGFSGGRIRRYGKGNNEYFLFNDGGTENRMEFNYYSYDPYETEPIRKIIMTGPDEYWGLSTRDGTDLWAGGAPILDFGENQSRIYYGSIRFAGAGDGGGNIHVRMIDLGIVGGGSGPLAFDSSGNLYYAQGYNWPFESDAYIYRFSAAEVADAIDDPKNHPLDVTEDWDIIIFNGWGDCCLGASSMFFHNKIGLVLTATTAHGNSELRWYAINSDGSSGGYTVLALSTGRMSETRYRNSMIYVNDPDGIYCIDMTSSSLAMMQ